MAIDTYLDRIDDVLEEAWNLPFTGGKRMIDIEKVRELMDEIRLNLPLEIKEARKIVADREEIIRDAKTEAEDMIKSAETRARKMISEEEIMISANERSRELLNETHAKARAAERVTLEFSETTLRKAEEVLLDTYNEIKNKRLSLRGRGNSGKQ